MLLTFSFLNNNYRLLTLDLCAIGDESDFERRMDDLKLLYRAYVTDALSGGRIEENKVNSNQFCIRYYIVSLVASSLESICFRCCILYPGPMQFFISDRLSAEW